MTFYKPLTPAFRSDITAGIHKNMTELNTCQQAIATSRAEAYKNAIQKEEKH